MRSRAAWVLAAITGATPALSGCSSNWMAERQQRELYEEQQNLGMLLERARFELHCPEAQLSVLERFQGATEHQHMPATLVGVDGCGRQSMYKRRLRRRYGHGRTTDNTKWEPTGPSPAFAYPAPPAPPSQVMPPSPEPLPEAPPPKQEPLPLPAPAATPANSPVQAPPARVFGTVAPAAR